MLRNHRHEYAGATADFSEAIRIDPSCTRAYLGRASANNSQKEFAASSADLTKALQLAPGNANVCRKVAWNYSTCPEANFRDGKKAVEIARKGCELTKWQDPETLHVLAAAYAEQGEFGKAVKFQEQALAFPDFVKEYGQEAQEQLVSYRAGKPWRTR